MKITNTTREGSKATVDLELSYETVEKAKSIAYNKAKKDILLPGFRKGHAPRKMVESIYGADVFLEDAVNEIFPRILDCLTESGLKVVGIPSVTKLDKLEGGNYTMTLEVSLYPEVTLGQYKGLEVPKASAEVPESDIDKEIERMAETVSRLESVEREARFGDTANIDFVGFIDGVVFDGGSDEDFDLELGSDEFIPGFEDQVIGMNIGEEKDIDVTFPEDYQDDLAGKPAVFHVVLNDLKEKIMPELDDEFVKDVSEFDTMEELRSDIRTRFEKEKAESVESAFKSAALEMALGNTEADLPDCMVDEELEYQMKQTTYQLAMNGMTMEQYTQIFGGEEKMREIMRPNAARQVKTKVMLAKIAEVEAFEISEEDIEKEYERMSEIYGMPTDKIKARLVVEDVKADLLDRKAIELIVENAIAVAPAAEEAAE